MKKLAIVLAAALVLGPSVSSANAQSALSGLGNILQNLGYGNGLANPYLVPNGLSNLGPLSGDPLLGSLAGIDSRQFRALQDIDPRFRNVRLSDLRNPGIANWSLSQLLNARLSGWTPGMLNNGLLNNGFAPAIGSNPYVNPALVGNYPFVGNGNGYGYPAFSNGGACMGKRKFNRGLRKGWYKNGRMNANQNWRFQ